MVVEGPNSIRLAVVRRPVSVVLESEIRMRMPTGDWEPFAFRLLSNRNIEFEKLSPPVYAGEIHARLAQSLRLVESGAKGGETDRVLEIFTGHKHFQIRWVAWPPSARKQHQRRVLGWLLTPSLPIQSAAATSRMSSTCGSFVSRRLSCCKRKLPTLLMDGCSKRSPARMASPPSSSTIGLSCSRTEFLCTSRAHSGRCSARH
eukprot:scaffold42727_cov26-Tisochrysis_lutea.AAC.3